MLARFDLLFVFAWATCPLWGQEEGACFAFPEAPGSIVPSAAPDLLQSGHWRSPANACVNALFMLAWAHRAPVAYSDLANAISDRGPPRTARDVLHLAREGGVELWRTRTSLRDIGLHSLPALLHLDPVDSDRDNGGQFVLWASVQDDFREATLYDCGACVRFERSFKELQDQWSGLAFTIESAGSSPRELLALFTICLLVGAFASRLRRIQCS